MEELDDKLASLKASVKTDVDNCSKLKIELKRPNDATHDIVDKGKAERTFIASKKCLKNIVLSETYMKENSVQIESALTFLADSDVHQYLSNLSGLGKIVLSTKEILVFGDKDQTFTVQGKSEYDVSIPSDSQKSFYINAMCVLSDQIIVADVSNKRIKLLNHQYQVVDHCDLTAAPCDMCQITPSEVAVTMGEDEDDTNEVQFVSVSGGQLVESTKLLF
ncbi:uncharacterized protein LOC127855740 [Dreissena polymorpha]|uniref:Uncharacterized protein n=1 Tax=Dreissena polymorpha TaxID=45954 RepID=A0A9D4C5F9_DREPO|nr:uncharacterized protein LOC127855740 [Dreissena polymorpha]KAH3717420.1 hypothetical protein DPMN_060207 [Dreissena polymorpha]